MLRNAKWILHPENKLYEAVCFKRELDFAKKIKKATLYITSLGVYYAEIDGVRVGDFILAPGFTSRKRVQYQTYDITKMINKGSALSVSVAEGWYKGKINFGTDEGGPEKKKALKARIDILFTDGTGKTIVTDEGWLVKRDKIRYAELYDGETVDANYEDIYVNAKIYGNPPAVTVVKQQGVYVKEQEILRPLCIFTAKNGDKLIDFGQNMTGYFEIEADAHRGDRIALSVCEVLDRDGNFYNENYRDAKARFEYICHEGHNVYKPKLAFWGFRYMKIEEFPCEITASNIKAIVLHSDIKRTGYLESSSPLLNQLFSNIIWGQKGNFLDVPTDCPQRDERQGWTGDATVFSRTATFNYDVEKFFIKWLTDLKLDQEKNGHIPHIIPQTICWDWSTAEHSGAVWGDSSTIIPYQLYLTYGNKEILARQYTSMCRYIKYITEHTKEKYLWAGCEQFGDWLGLDAPAGSYRGSSNEDFIASVFYAHSTLLVAKTGKILGRRVDKYEKLYKKIVEKIRMTFTEYKTQTECALALYFNIAENKSAVANQLATMIKENGNRLKTGFVGTPYLLHALSQNGYAEVAYDLLLQEEFPSWLYSVKQGATTIWEHWDGRNDKGEFWSYRMNSFNHYAYGSVADWVYMEACGIHTVEEKPGFEEVIISPIPTDKLDCLSAKIETRHGTVSSKWYHFDGKIRYEIITPVPATIIINGKEHRVPKGTYIF
ncbi:MAG: family 78 glycoside hydrolase catalytic domain [Clostridia bacterium]|nr:family 78 glycoside hydrolase catalytic domain [Clostridia bacterium]